MHASMKTMCSPGYHQNGVVSTHALRNMMYIEPYIMCPSRLIAKVHCGDNWDGTLFHDSINIMSILHRDRLYIN